MKFSKPITRELDIDGNTFNVTFSDTGIEFRLKGKRKTARVEWTTVLGAARGEQGENAHELLGIERGSEAPGPFASQATTGATESKEAFHAQGAQATNERETNESATNDSSRDTGEELSRSVSAGEVGPES